MKTTPGSKAHLLKLFNDEKYSDVVVECGYKRFHVLKALICQNKYFEKCCGTDSFKEGSEGKITIEEADPYAVWAVLVFLYCGDYGYVVENSGLTLMLHTNVYVLADMWEVDSLDGLALQNIREYLGEGSDGDETSDVLAAAKIAYEDTPESHSAIRDLFADYIFKNSTLLFGKRLRENIHETNRKQLESIPTLVIAIAVRAMNFECPCNCHEEKDYYENSWPHRMSSSKKIRSKRCRARPELIVEEAKIESEVADEPMRWRWNDG